MERRSPRDHSDDDLIGREAEILRLESLLVHADQGRGGLVEITGEPGIGKSTLAAKAGRSAMARGFRVVQGRAWTEAPAWLAMAPCISSLGLALPPAGESESRFAFFGDVLASLAASAVERPQLWIIEDVHAADAATLDLLGFLAAPLRTMRALVIVTTRTDALKGRDPALDQRIGRLRALGSELLLGPLTDDNVARIAAHVLGRTLNHLERDELTRRAGGNPLFVVECMRGAALGQRVISRTVHEIVRDRLVHVSAPTRELLRAAAILGGEPTAGVLAAMMGELPATVIDRLEPARRHGVLLEVEPGKFRFTHAIVAEALIAELPAEARAALHTRAFAGLAVLGDAPGVRVQRAHQHLSAVLLGAPPSNVDVVNDAIRWLDERGAPDRAFELERRRHHARSLGVLPPATTDELIATARLAARAGSFEAARRVALEAIARASAEDDAVRFAEAALTLGFDTVAAKVDPVLVEALERVLDRLPTNVEPLRVRVSARLAAARQPAPDPRPFVDLARDAIERALRLGDDAVLCDALYYGGAALTDCVPPVELKTVAERLLEVAVRQRDRARTLRAAARLALASGALGDFAGFDRAIDLAMHLAKDAPPALAWRALLLSSMRAFARGALVESERLCVEVERLGQLTDDPGLQLALYAHRLQCESILGTEAAVRSGADHLVTNLEGFGIPRQFAALVRAILLARVEDRDAAAAELLNAPSDFTSAASDCTMGFPNVGEAYALAGCDRERRAARDALTTVAPAHLFSGHVPMTYEGPRARVLGLLSASLGEHEAAEAHLRAAIAACEAAGFRTWEARTRFELGSILVRAGRTANGAQELAAAGALLERLGAPLTTRLRERVEQMRAFSLPPRRTKAEGAATFASQGFARTAPLECEREGEIWVLRWNDRTVRLAHSRGIELLARLVQRAGEEVHVLSLSSDAEHALSDSTAGDTIDKHALTEYRRRLDAIARELGLARLGKGKRRKALEEEKVWLEREIARGLGVSGRVRSVGSLAERARVNVQRRLREAIAKVAERDQALGAHLQQAVRTGTYCTYRP